jgi:hypothetical protein
VAGLTFGDLTRRVRRSGDGVLLPRQQEDDAAVGGVLSKMQSFQVRNSHSEKLNLWVIICPVDNSLFSHFPSYIYTCIHAIT